MSIALIKNNNVILGPMPWNYFLFKEELEKVGINYTNLPQETPSDLPLVFENGVKIVTVNRIIPDHHSELQFLTGPTWNFEVNPVEATYGIDDYPIEYSKVLLKSILSNRRAEKINSTTITFSHQDKTLRFDLKDESRNYLYSLLSSMQDNTSINFKSKSTDGKIFVTMTKNELQLVCNALNNEVQNFFDWEKGIYDQIEAAPDLQTLINITF